MPNVAKIKYKLDQLDIAIQAVNDKGWSVHKASKTYVVPKTTLYDRTHGRYKERNGTLHKGAQTALDAETEAILVKYLLYMADCGMPLTRKVFSIMVKGVIQKMQLTTPFTDDTPSYKWMRNFLKRHNEVALRTPDPLEPARANIDAADLTNYHALLREVTQDLDAGQIFNCDETGFSGKDAVRVKVLAKKGKKRVYQQQVKFPGHTTVLSTVCADGTTLPPVVIFQGSCPDVEGVPEEWRFNRSKSGWINTEIFAEWFADIFVPATTRKQRPILLIMDNHVSHASVHVLDLAERNGIHLLFLPPHTSHFLQPLDLGYFNTLKQLMGNVAVSLGYGGVKIKFY